MPIPTIEQALDQMRAALGGAMGNPNIGAEYHSAVVGVAVASAVGETVGAAVGTLTRGVDELRRAQADFISASDAGTKELARWSETTAKWTKGLATSRRKNRFADLVRSLPKE